MGNELAKRNDQAAVIEQVVVQGDLSDLTPEQRTEYYVRVCESLGINYLTKPFDYIKLNGRLTLYARRDATDQIRRIHGVSITIVSRERVDDLYIVTARATDMDGRSDESTGVVSIGRLSGDNLANALMKAETKAKRRVTLSLVGLGWLDETEIETIPSAHVERVEPQPRPEPQGNGNDNAHWIDGDRARKAFWAYVDQLGLGSADVYAALGVESMHDYDGSMLECKETLEAWIAEQASAEAAPEALL